MTLIIKQHPLWAELMWGHYVTFRGTFTAEGRTSQEVMTALFALAEGRVFAVPLWD